MLSVSHVSSVKRVKWSALGVVVCQVVSVPTCIQPFRDFWLQFNSEVAPLPLCATAFLELPVTVQSRSGFELSFMINSFLIGNFRALCGRRSSLLAALGQRACIVLCSVSLMDHRNCKVHLNSHVPHKPLGGVVLL